MTAEIAILNKGAVALAADSAVTVTLGDEDIKVYSSQNKIFALTKGGRVGVLVYGSAEFMSIPMETLVKEYRRRYGGVEYPQLSDYVEAFVTFLRDEIIHYTTKDQQDRVVLEMVRHIFQVIRMAIDERLEILSPDFSEDGEEVDEEELEALTAGIIDSTIRQYHQRALEAKKIEDASESVSRSVQNLLRSRLKRIRENFFGPSVSALYARRLNAIAYKVSSVMLEEIAPEAANPYTGVVMAGFGLNELFPSYVEIRLEGAFEGILKYDRGQETQISPEMRATIAPFAQRDMVHMFMEGISPRYLDVLLDAATQGIKTYTGDLLNGLDRYTAEERTELASRLETEQQGFAVSFMERVLHFGRRHFAAEIVDVVAMLPKEQLAELAETLIGLTSLRRRVTYEKETVGGPTDVAIITKGDGLVWVKRKHYFEENLNPAYFARTYGSVE